MAHLDAGKGLYVEGNHFGADHSSYLNYGLWGYLATDYIDYGSSYTTGNVDTLYGQPGTWAEGVKLAYMYRQVPDHYVDNLDAPGSGAVLRCQQGKGRLIYNIEGSPQYRTIVSSFVFGAIKNAASSHTKQQLMAQYLAYLSGDIIPPEMPQNAGISTAPGWIRLTWLPVSQDIYGYAEPLQCYRVYRGTTAHFVPTPAHVVGEVMMPQFNDFDPSVVGDPGTNYFYLVCAVDLAGNESEGTPTLGEFDFATP